MVRNCRNSNVEVFFTMKKNTNRIRNVIELIVSGASLLLTCALCWGLWIAEAMQVSSKICLILILAYLVVNIVLAFSLQGNIYSKLIQITFIEAVQIVPAYIISIVARVFS